MLGMADLIVFAMGGGVLATIVAVWMWINKTVKVAKESGRTEEKLKQSHEALDALRKAHNAKIGVERDSLDPRRLRDDDGYRRD